MFKNNLQIFSYSHIEKYAFTSFKLEMSRDFWRAHPRIDPMEMGWAL